MDLIWMDSDGFGWIRMDLEGFGMACRSQDIMDLRYLYKMIEGTNVDKHVDFVMYQNPDKLG